jgi:hypothetical protein
LSLLSARKVLSRCSVSSRQVCDEGGAPTVSSYSSFWRVGCRGVLGCSTGRRESCLGGRGLMLTGRFTRTERCYPVSNLQRRQRRFSDAGHECARRVKSSFFGVRSSKKKCGQCPHFPPRTASYSRRTGPDSACFRHFPAFARLGIPFESHLGHGIPPRQRGVLL